MTEFVLVPGAWLGGWAWARTIPYLEEKGHTAHPITLTGEGERVHLASKDVGMETAIEDVLKVVEFADLKDFVLVGHSFAGKVVASVADRISDKVSSVIYVDAFRPDKVRAPQGAFDPQEFHPSPGSLGVPLTAQIIDAIGSDVRGADREWLLAKATPWPLKHANEPITLSEGFDSLKSAYVFCKGGGDPVDEIVSGKWGKLDGPYRIIDSGHWPMITKPEELANDLVDLSDEIG